MEQKYDLYSPAFKANPYPTFAAMRRQDPVYRQPGLDVETPIWFVTRYAEVEAVLRDDRRFTRDWRRAYPGQEPEEPSLDLIDHHMLNRDGADHHRLRGLVSKAFTPRMISGMRDRIQAIADELLDGVQDQGEMDLVEAFAFPLPIIVIAELLGVPPEDRDKFRVWSNAVVTPDLSEGSGERFLAMMHAFTGYLRQLFEMRRQNPGDDLISGLLQAEAEGDKLNEAELFSTVVLLIVAGHETTVTLIGNAVLTLLQHPEQMGQLRQDPSRIPGAVEEILRFDSPVERALVRWAMEDVTLGGQLIRRGEPVIVILGAANRDGQQFDNPDEFDVDREEGRHLAFGRGVHYCLGAPLARLEGEVALSTLLRRIPNVRLNCAPEDLVWRPVPLFHSLAALPVAW